MNDVHGAAPAGGENQAAEAPDDGFTAEERAQFADMQKETAAPAPVSDTPVPAAPAVDADAGQAAQAAAGEDDDDDGEPAAGAPGAAAAADGRKPRRVSFSKYDRETRELKAALDKANATVAERDAMQARLDERLKIINEALTTPQTPAETVPAAPPLPKAEDDPEPNMEEDIFAWNQWNRREQLRLREEVRQTTQQQQQERQETAAEQQTNQSYLSDAETFAGKEPNFVPAYQFLMASRVGELAVHYFDKDLSDPAQKLTPQEYARISQTIVAEEKSIVSKAIKEGKSPAAQLYKIARTRGFKPAAAGAPAPAGDGKGGNGAAPAAGNQRPTASAKAPGALDSETGQVSVVDEIQRVRNGQDAALSLSGGGGAPPAPLDAVKLANMPQDEFEEMMENMSPSQIKKIMGG